MNKKYLLVTSDDFGISHSVNQGILQGFQKGVLQSTNFMAAAPWFPEAVRIAKQHKLPVGVHLTITCEWTNLKCSPITSGKSIRNSLGYFYDNYEALLQTVDIEELKNEYRAQIQRVIDHGIEPTHVETHMLPGLVYNGMEKYQLFADAVSSVAKEFGLIYTYAANNQKLKYFDDSFESTHMSYDEVVGRLSQYDSGIYHLICHCAFVNEEQSALANRADDVHKWAANCRQQDLDIITSQPFKRFLDANNFELITIQKLKQLHRN
jgi:predicted glycoside hydrolase/deacetylase ChbG (UPF0249 family)